MTADQELKLFVVFYDDLINFLIEWNNDEQNRSD